MKRKLLITGMILFSVLCSTHASAQPCRKMAGVAKANQTGWSCPVWLNLAPEQQTAINTIRNDFIKEASTIQNQIHKKRLEMDIMLLEAEPDTDTLLKMQKDISALNASLDEKQISYQMKARKKLSREQIGQLPPGCNLGFGRPAFGPGQGNGPCFNAGMGCRGYGNRGW